MADADALQGAAKKIREGKGPSRRDDGIAWKLLVEREGDDWTDMFDDDVWHRRDPEDGCAFDGPPRLTSCMSDAIALVREVAPDFDWTIESGGSATLRSQSEPHLVVLATVPGEPERALTAALLQLKARG